MDESNDRASILWVRRALIFTVVDLRTGLRGCCLDSIAELPVAGTVGNERGKVV
jgi:hypothetical protein